MLRTESEQTVKYDETTGDFPSFTTTAGKFDYEAAADVWRVSEVLLPEPLFREYGIYYGSLYSQESNLVHPVEKRRYGGRIYLRVQQMATVDQLRDSPTSFQNTKMLFRIDPGAYTYYYLGYKKPVSMTSENIQIPLPEHLHPYVYQATVALLNGYQNGNIVEAMELVTDELRPIIREAMNEGEQGENSFVEIREL